MMDIPPIGIGTWELYGQACENAVRIALEVGYRHIDTAHMYENQSVIKKAMVGFDRSKLFITSKFILEQLENTTVNETCEIALKELGTDYLDLYLLHYPNRNAPMEKILQDLSHLKENGKCRFVGVSNCTIRHLKDSLEWGFHPDANQVEFHPYLYQKELLTFCQKHKISLISYRSLGKGALVHDPAIQSIGTKYGKTSPQILLRWCHEKNIPVIPKGSSREHIEENFAIFDFSISKEDMAFLDGLNENRRYCCSHWADFEYR